MELTQEVRYARLLPHQFFARRAECPVLYFPLGPLEWHGVHISPGMDALNAEAVAEELARRTGGVVYPTLYMGSERYHTEEFVEKLRIDPVKYTNSLGMDFGSGEVVPSVYFTEDVFAIALREHLRKLMELDFKVILILSGHAAQPHMEIIKRIADEFNRFNPQTTIIVRVAISAGKDDKGVGHANKLETALLMHIAPDSVDISQLPAKPEKLRTADTAIADPETFENKNPDNYVIHDPRDADAEYGRKAFERAVAEFGSLITDALKAMIKK